MPPVPWYPFIPPGRLIPADAPDDYITVYPAYAWSTQQPPPFLAPGAARLRPACVACQMMITTPINPHPGHLRWVARLPTVMLLAWERPRTIAAVSQVDARRLRGPTAIATGRRRGGTGPHCGRASHGRARPRLVSCPSSSSGLAPGCGTCGAVVAKLRPCSPHPSMCPQTLLRGLANDEQGNLTASS